MNTKTKRKTRQKKKPKNKGIQNIVEKPTKKKVEKNLKI